MMTLNALIYNRVYLAISFDPECWSSSGHYPKIRKYTETVVYRKVEGFVNAAMNFWVTYTCVFFLQVE